jgi:hypothetical protein
MNRVLNRPMFRIGGSAGTGITSGLDQPRKQYQNGERVTQGLDPYVRDTMTAFKKFGAMPRQSPLAAGTLPGFLTQFGLNLVSQTPGGNIFQTAGMAAQEPFKQFQTGVAQRGQQRADLNRAIVAQAIKSKESQDAADASMKKTQMLIDNELELFDKELAGDLEKIKLKAKLNPEEGAKYSPREQAANAYEATFVPELERLNGLIASTEDVELRGQYESDKNALMEKIANGKRAIFLDQNTSTEFARDVILKILQGAASAGNLEDQEGITDIFNAISTIYPNYKEILGPDFQLPQPMAEGGRAGYNVGGMTNPVAATQAKAQVQDLSYSELRSRLPESISNDVVNILANSKQALLDFANIRDQQDVDEFNQRYNVNLTIPQEG